MVPESTSRRAFTQVLRAGARACTRLGDVLTGLVTGLVTGLARRLGRLGPAMLAVGLGLAGCEAKQSPVAVPPVTPPAPVEAVASAPDVHAEPAPIGAFNITFYYMIGEEEVTSRSVARLAAKQRAARAAAANDNLLASAGAPDDGDPEAHPAGDPDEVGELASIVMPELVPVYEGRSCEQIAEVTREFAGQLEMQGTGKLKDGRVLNIWGTCRCGRSPCFKVTSATWGTAGTGRALQPFRTVAVDPRVIKLGTLLYVPVLEGRTMPGRAPWGGFVHDGCVVADDVGGAIKGKQLDLFVGRRGHHLGLSGSGGSHAWARGVEVFDGTRICERKGRQVRKTGSI